MSRRHPRCAGYHVGGRRIAALRLRGASWDDIGGLLGTSRQAAHRRFAPWVQRYLPIVIGSHPRRPMPANRAETRARLRESTDLGKDHIDAMHQAIARVAYRGLGVAAEPPP
jgi:hypothetical protein